MKPTVDSFIASFKIISSSKTKKKKTKTTARSVPSFASVPSSLSSSSSSDEFPHAAGPQSTPKSVLPKHDPSLHDLFSVFDLDGDGKITQRELEVVLRRLGQDPPTAEEVARMVADVDRDGDGCISLEEFAALEAALGPAAAADEDGGAAELREAFRVFDADGDGMISSEELQDVFAALGDAECTLEDCRRMIDGIDSGGEGFVCFQDFVRMMDGQR